MFSAVIEFASPAEKHFVEQIEPYGIDWLYQPVSFALQTNSRGEALERFCPDFYLPELNTYVEVSTFWEKLFYGFRQRLKKFKKLYPHIEIKTLSPRDFQKFIKDCI